MFLTYNYILYLNARNQREFRYQAAFVSPINMHNLCMLPFFCIFLVVLLWRNRNWANGDHRSHSLRDLSKLLGLMNILSIFIQNTFNLFLCFDYIYIYM